MSEGRAKAAPAGGTLLVLLLLLDLACAGAGADRGATPGGNGAAWFTEVSSENGLGFRHETGARGHLHLPEIMGAGVALLDYDSDGDLDVYLTSGNADPVRGQASPGSPSRLYRQEADGHFTDVTVESGTGSEAYGMGVAVGDVENDGDLDLYVTNFGPNRLYLNRGDGTFEDATERSGAAVGGWSTSAAFADYDRDGLLDLYVARYVEFDPHKNCFDPAGRPEYCGPREFPPVSDVLLHNEGGARFNDVSVRAGIASVAAAGLGVVHADVDDDGWLDFYVANDAYANHLWINKRDGTFRESAILLGAAYNVNGRAQAGMGVIAADFDDDLRFDLFVTNLSQETNTFHRNLGGDRGFSDATGEFDLGASSMAWTGFGTVPLDVDLDGDLDLAVANGRVNRTEPRPDARVDAPWSSYAEPNLFYVNEAGRKMRLVERETAAFSASVEVSRGLAVGDVDNDGDPDLLLTNLHGAARLYRNDHPRTGHWVTLTLVDPRLGREAIGARAILETGGRRSMRQVTRAFSYLSSNDARVSFGLGAHATIDAVEVLWPDGWRERFTGLPVDAFVELRRGAGTSGP